MALWNIKKKSKRKLVWGNLSVYHTLNLNIWTSETWELEIPPKILYLSLISKVPKCSLIVQEICTCDRDIVSHCSVFEYRTVNNLQLAFLRKSWQSSIQWSYTCSRVTIYFGSSKWDLDFLVRMAGHDQSPAVSNRGMTTSASLHSVDYWNHTIDSAWI